MAPLVVCQTTIRAELLDSILQILERNDVEYIIKNTICNATKDRQDSCAELASRVDAMIVVGGKNSSNTKKLYEIASRYCKSSYFVQNADELELHCIKKYNKIGIIAGASTPEWIIEEVISGMTINEEMDLYMNIEIKMQDGGIMRGELYPETAPVTVENFVKLINESFFDGLVFHRVIKDFMIQVGGFTADGQHK